MIIWAYLDWHAFEAGQRTTVKGAISWRIPGIHRDGKYLNSIQPEYRDSVEHSEIKKSQLSSRAKLVQGKGLYRPALSKLKNKPWKDQSDLQITAFKKNPENKKLQYFLKKGKIQAFNNVALTMSAIQ